MQQPLFQRFWHRNGVGRFWCKQRRIIQGINSAAINQYMPCQPSLYLPATGLSRRKPASLNGNPHADCRARTTFFCREHIGFPRSKTISWEAEQKAITTASAATSGVGCQVRENPSPQWRLITDLRGEQPTAPPPKKWGRVAVISGDQRNLKT